VWGLCCSSATFRYYIVDVITALYKWNEYYSYFGVSGADPVPDYPLLRSGIAVAIGYGGWYQIEGNFGFTKFESTAEALKQLRQFNAEFSHQLANDSQAQNIVDQFDPHYPRTIELHFQEALTAEQFTQFINENQLNDAVASYEIGVPNYTHSITIQGGIPRNGRVVSQDVLQEFVQIFYWQAEEYRSVKLYVRDWQTYSEMLKFWEHPAVALIDVVDFYLLSQLSAGYLQQLGLSTEKITEFYQLPIRTPLVNFPLSDALHGNDEIGMPPLKRSR